MLARLSARQASTQQCLRRAASAGPTSAFGCGFAIVLTLHIGTPRESAAAMTNGRGSASPSRDGITDGWRESGWAGGMRCWIKYTEISYGYCSTLGMQTPDEPSASLLRLIFAPRDIDPCIRDASPAPCSVRRRPPGGSPGRAPGADFSPRQGQGKASGSPRPERTRPDDRCAGGEWLVRAPAESSRPQRLLIHRKPSPVTRSAGVGRVQVLGPPQDAASLSHA